MDEARTTCAIAGGGPAGLFLGLVLARAGVEVTVLEKHADFLRDFRGDTVHVSTMTLIDELGLWDRFADLPWKPIETARVVMDAGPATIADMRRLHQPHPFIAMVPQWHLLDMLAAAAAEEPTFTLIRNAEVVDLRRPVGASPGLRWRERGRGRPAPSTPGRRPRRRLRRARLAASAALTGLPLRDFDVPMDVWWFRLPRGEGDDPAGGSGG